MSKYATAVKQRWRDWQKRMISQTKMRKKPFARKTLLLDPLLAETEMLESIGYRAGNITVVERDPQVFAQIVDRNEHRRRNGLEPVRVVNKDLEDFFADMILGVEERERFDHVSLDMLYQLNEQHYILLALCSAGCIINNESIVSTNLQARRERISPDTFNEAWHLNVGPGEELIESALEGASSYQSAIESIANAYEEYRKSQPEDIVQKRRDGRENIHDLRGNLRIDYESMFISNSWGLFDPDPAPIRFVRFLISRECEPDFLDKLLITLNRKNLVDFMKSALFFGQLVKKILEGEMNTSETGKRTGLSFEYLYYIHKNHNGILCLDSASMYRYISASATPMISTLYRFSLKRERLKQALLTPLEQDFFEICSKFAGLKIKKQFSFSPTTQNQRAYYRALKRALKNMDAFWDKNKIAINATKDMVIDESTPDERVPSKDEVELKIAEIDGGENEPIVSEEKEALGSKEEIYRAFEQNPDWNVKDLKANFDVSAFSNGQLGAYKAWVTIRAQKESKTRD
jgi:hypothetical protein